MRFRNRESGSALIELAVSLTLLVTLLTGIFYVGYTFYAYENLVNAVRAGARYASLRAPGCAGETDFAGSVKNLIVYGDPHARGGKPVVAGLAPEHVEVVLELGAATVAVRGFTIDALFAKVRLNGRPTATFPVAGVAR